MNKKLLRLRSRKQIIIVLFLILLVAILSYGLYAHFARPKSDAELRAASQQKYAQEQVDEVRARKIPTEPKKKASYYVDLAYAYRYTNDFNKSNEAFDQAAKIFESEKNYGSLITVYGTMAKLSIKDKNNTKAKEYYAKQLELMKSHNSDGAYDEMIAMTKESLSALK